MGFGVKLRTIPNPTHRICFLLHAIDLKHFEMIQIKDILTYILPELETFLHSCDNTQVKLSTQLFHSCSESVFFCKHRDSKNDWKDSCEIIMNNLEFS